MKKLILCLLLLSNALALENNLIPEEKWKLTEERMLKETLGIKKILAFVFV